MHARSLECATRIMGQLYKDLQYWRGHRSLRPSIEILRACIHCIQ